MAKCAWCGSENSGDGRFCPKCGRTAQEAIVPGKCPECGAINAIDMSKCGNCGTALPEVRPEMMPKPKPRRACKWCGNEAIPDGDECYECMRRHTDTSMGTVERAKAKGGLAIGAVLLMVAGVLAFVQGVFYLFLESALAAMDVSSYGGVGCCGLIDILFGLGAIAGGYFAFKRTNYLLALAGGVLGMLGLGFMIGGLLGLVALILIAMEKAEFD